ncbi:TetR family transcriptional regulator [Streptosporangium sandarakinum]|uniref:TetR family transcriptional regulator n=1 Tax=Streptosporangium sandarakinum TaxID=1260955 RepID=UPI003440CB67
MTGLRHLKKQRTHEAVSAAAISLFLERGFDAVSVAEVAAAAEVSKPTLFKYFPTKEDLVLHRITDHRGESARVVRGRGPGTDPLTALHRHFLDGLARRDPVTGLNDDPEVLAYHRMIFSTPSLAARLMHHMTADEEALADALTETAAGPGGAGGAGGSEDAEGPDGSGGPGGPGGSGGPGGPGGSGAMDDLVARLVAGQVLAVQRVLARRNWAELVGGRTASEVHPEAVSAADRAFALLRDGLGSS